MDHPDANAGCVIEEIRAAFRDVEKGQLTLHQAILSTWADEEHVLANQGRSHKRWEEITDKEIEAGGKALYGADPKSWRFFIPAFMIWSLRFLKVNDAFVSDQTIYSFDPEGVKPASSLSKLERFQLLSLPQKRAIRRFLEYMARNDSYADATFAQKAINQYWGHYK